MKWGREYTITIKNGIELIQLMNVLSTNNTPLSITCSFHLPDDNAIYFISPLTWKLFDIELLKNATQICIWKRDM